MPKKIPIIEMRKWLDLHEQGEAEAKIAKDANRDVRTIKKGIEHARRERDGHIARSELLKDALVKHHSDLIGVVDEILSALIIPDAYLDVPWEPSPDSSIRLSGAIGKYKIINNDWIVIFQNEGSTLWELLMDHLKLDPIPQYIKGWKDTLGKHITARISLSVKTATLLERETGLQLFERVPDHGSYLDSRAIVPLIYRYALCSAIGIDSKIDPEHDIDLNTTDGTITYCNNRLAMAPSQEAECRDAILEVAKQLVKSSESENAASTYKKLQTTTPEVRQMVEEISLIGLVPGQCRVCKRLGISI